MLKRLWLKRLWLVCCACLALGLARSSAAQYVAVGNDKPIPVGKLDEMESLLPLSGAPLKADLLVRLGIPPAVAQMASQNPIPGQAIELRPVRAPGKIHYGIAFLPSGTETCCYLYLLQGSDEASDKRPWHVIGSQHIDCWFGPATLEIMPLRQPEADDLVLHHVMEGHGSGYAAYQTQVFSVLDGKLVQTLATQDFLSQVTMDTGDTLEQKSTFLRFPGNLLEESRTSSENERLDKVERRYWRWSAPDHKFLASPFLLVVPPRARE